MEKVLTMAECKLGEKGCWKDGKCHYIHDCENKVLTNADRIRSMSDEELADFIEMKQFFALANNGTDGEEYTLKWLQSEVEEEP